MSSCLTQGHEKVPQAAQLGHHWVIFSLITRSVSCPGLLRLDLCVCIICVYVGIHVGFFLVRSPAALSLSAWMRDLHPAKPKLLPQAKLHHSALSSSFIFSCHPQTLLSTTILTLYSNYKKIHLNK